jgi:hypothetical protein
MLANDLPDYLSVKTPTATGSMAMIGSERNFAVLPSQLDKESYQCTSSALIATLFQGKQSSRRSTTTCGDFYANNTNCFLDTYNQLQVSGNIEMEHDTRQRALPPYQIEFDALELTASGFNDVYNSAIDSIDLICMEPAMSGMRSFDPIMTSSEDMRQIPDLLASITPKFDLMLPMARPLAQSVQHLGREVLESQAISSYSPRTTQILRQTIPERQILYMIFHRLIDGDHKVRTLTRSRTQADKLFGTGLKSIFTLEGPLLAELLDSIPLLYRSAIEQGLFCAAVEMNAANVLEAICGRGFDCNRPFSFGTLHCYPLERACWNKHVEATRVLLKCGANPAKYLHRHTLAALFHPPPDESQCPYLSQQDSRITPIIHLLFDFGATMEQNDVLRIENHCTSEEMSFSAPHLLMPGPEMFNLGGSLQPSSREKTGKTIIFQ